MTKLMTFAIAGVLFAVAGCGPSTSNNPGTTNTTPANNGGAMGGDAGAMQGGAMDGGAAPAPTP